MAEEREDPRRGLGPTSGSRSRGKYREPRSREPPGERARAVGEEGWAGGAERSGGGVPTRSQEQRGQEARKAEGGNRTAL